MAPAIRRAVSKGGLFARRIRDRYPFGRSRWPLSRRGDLTPAFANLSHVSGMGVPGNDSGGDWNATRLDNAALREQSLRCRHDSPTIRKANNHAKRQ